MKNVAVILARGGSKGIPNKNIALLNGRPLIYYSIKAAILSDADQVWVNTDSEEIAEVAKKYEAKIYHRPPEFATDTASSESALLNFCKNVVADNIIFIQPTSPLIEYQDINNGLVMMKDFDSIFSGYKEHWIPRWNIDMTEYNWSISSRPRRQDVEEKIVENGAFYISKRNLILESGLRYSGKIGCLIMPYSKSFQVDCNDDLSIIESLLSQRDRIIC